MVDDSPGTGAESSARVETDSTGADEHVDFRGWDVVEFCESPTSASEESILPPARLLPKQDVTNWYIFGCKAGSTDLFKRIE
jgi:hypothetical protein